MCYSNKKKLHLKDGETRKRAQALQTVLNNKLLSTLWGDEVGDDKHEGKGIMSFTLWQVWWDIWQFLGVDVRPVKVIVRILLVVTLREALIKCTTSCRKEKQQNVVKFTKRQRWSLLPWLNKRTHLFKLTLSHVSNLSFVLFYMCAVVSAH